LDTGKLDGFSIINVKASFSVNSLKKNLKGVRRRDE